MRLDDRIPRDAPPDVRTAVAGAAPGWPLVLYFHHVHPTLDHYTSLTPASFERGLETVLADYGPALDPASAEADMAPPAAPTVLVTFDDGHRDNLDHALPILDRLGVRALFFAITGLAGEAPDRSMTWDELRGLTAAGHRVGSHTVTHRKLPELAAAEQHEEIAESLAAVGDRLGDPRPPLAYPYGMPPTGAAVPPGTLAFGTVKARPRPWTAAPHDVRRTYLPVGREQLWPRLCREWRQQWWHASP
ncbi:polysaccharide deacetylase family protein [Actinomadura macra]|uniref:polysaccharide deacetylase family protein n=1 Tax=Actinomadura macra TaxID=46164 RepID=UPI0008344AC7|nr:polysaccharide deacetylase family protein [Actinomadura macra]